MVEKHKGLGGKGNYRSGEPGGMLSPSCSGMLGPEKWDVLYTKGMPFMRVYHTHSVSSQSMWLVYYFPRKKDKVIEFRPITLRLKCSIVFLYCTIRFSMLICSWDIN